MYNKHNCGCTSPCKYEPIFLPVKECVCDRYFCVEQPIICPVNKKIVNHYVPKPVYYHTYTTSEENVCEQSCQMNGMNQYGDMKQNPFNR